MKLSVCLAIGVACLPSLSDALAIGVGLPKDAPGNHLEARNPIYPTKVTVRALPYPTKVTVRALPAYPTKVTVREKREAATTALDDGEELVHGSDLEKRAARPPKITLKTVRAKSDTGESKPTTTVRTLLFYPAYNNVIQLRNYHLCSHTLFAAPYLVVSCWSTPLDCC